MFVERKLISNNLWKFTIPSIVDQFRAQHFVHLILFVYLYMSHILVYSEEILLNFSFVIYIIQIRYLT